MKQNMTIARLMELHKDGRVDLSEIERRNFERLSQSDPNRIVYGIEVRHPSISTPRKDV